MIELTCYFDEDEGLYKIIDENGVEICKDGKQFYVLRKYFDKYEKNEVYYRGQTHGYELLPSIMRESYSHLYNSYNDYIQRVSIEHSIELKDCGNSYIRKLSKMQHYDFPTNLLDISKNPYKALGFMIDFDFNDYNDNLPPCIYIFKPITAELVSLSSLSGAEHPRSICTIIPDNNQIDNIRLHAQDGLFIYAPISITHEHYLNRLREKYEITKITVKVNSDIERRNIKDKLKQYHYALEDLYPDMIKRAEYYKKHWNKKD